MKRFYLDTLESFRLHQRDIHRILPWIMLPLNLVVAGFITLTAISDENLL